MKRLLLILLCLMMVLGMTACGDKDTGKGNTTTTTQAEDIYYATYAHDLIIDRFFVEYLEKYPKTSLNPNTILRGKDTSEYTAVIDECNVTLRNVSTEVEVGPNTTTMYLLRVTIAGGITDESRDHMMDAFSKIIRILDPHCTTDMANATISYLTAQKNTVADYKASSNIKVEQYIPIVKEYGVACRIDLLAYNFAPLEK